MVQIPENYFRQRLRQEEDARKGGDTLTANRISLDRRIVGSLKLKVQERDEEIERLRAGLKEIAGGVANPQDKALELLSGYISKVKL